MKVNRELLFCLANNLDFNYEVINQVYSVLNFKFINLSTKKRSQKNQREINITFPDMVEKEEYKVSLYYDKFKLNDKHNEDEEYFIRLMLYLFYLGQVKINFTDKIDLSNDDILYLRKSTKREELEQLIRVYIISVFKFDEKLCDLFVDMFFMKFLNYDTNRQYDVVVEDDYIICQEAFRIFTEIINSYPELDISEKISEYTQTYKDDEVMFNIQSMRTATVKERLKAIQDENITLYIDFNDKFNLIQHYKNWDISKEELYKNINKENSGDNVLIFQKTQNLGEKDFNDFKKYLYNIIETNTALDVNI